MSVTNEQIFKTHFIAGHRRYSGKKLKQSKNRTERRRARRDPECVPQYRRYEGWSD